MKALWIIPGSLAILHLFSPAGAIKRQQYTSLGQTTLQADLDELVPLLQSVKINFDALFELYTKYMKSKFEETLTKGKSTTWSLRPIQSAIENKKEDLGSGDRPTPSAIKNKQEEIEAEMSDIIAEGEEKEKIDEKKKGDDEKKKGDDEKKESTASILSQIIQILEKLIAENSLKQTLETLKQLTKKYKQLRTTNEIESLMTVTRTKLQQEDPLLPFTIGLREVKITNPIVKKPPKIDMYHLGKGLSKKVQDAEALLPVSLRDHALKSLGQIMLFADALGVLKFNVVNAALPSDARKPKNLKRTFTAIYEQGNARLGDLPFVQMYLKRLKTFCDMTQLLMTEF